MDDERARKPKGEVAAAAQARYHSDLGTTTEELAFSAQAGGPQLPSNADGSINVEKANKILQNMYNLIQFNKRLEGEGPILLDGATAEETRPEDPNFVTPTKKPKLGDEEHQGLGPTACPSHVRPARGSLPPLGEHSPPFHMHTNHNSHALLDELIGHVVL